MNVKVVVNENGYLTRMNKSQKNEPKPTRDWWLGKRDLEVNIKNIPQKYWGKHIRFKVELAPNQPEPTQYDEEIQPVVIQENTTPPKIQLFTEEEYEAIINDMNNEIKKKMKIGEERVEDELFTEEEYRAITDELNKENNTELTIEDVKNEIKRQELLDQRQKLLTKKEENYS